MTETLNINITTDDGVRFTVKCDNIVYPDLDYWEMWERQLKIIFGFQEDRYGRVLNKIEQYKLYNLGDKK